MCMDWWILETKKDKNVKQKLDKDRDDTVLLDDSICMYLCMYVCKK
jgi:hypothetical protein